MKYLVWIFGLSFMSPKRAGEAWQDQLGQLIEFASHDVSPSGPDAVTVFLPDDLFEMALSSNAFAQVIPTDGKPLSIREEDDIRERLTRDFLNFAAVNEIPVHAGHFAVVFTPSNQNSRTH